MNQSYKATQEIIENYRVICRAEPKNIENWLTLGRCLVETGQYDEAERALTKIFEEGRFFSFKKGVPRLRLRSLFGWFRLRRFFARAYSDLAMISLHQGNLAESERLLTMALAVFEKTKNDYEYALAANRLGMVYRLAGAFESAEEAHYRAKGLAERHGWSFVLAETLGNLGMVYEGKDRFEVALENHFSALDLYLKDDRHIFEAACQRRQIGLCFLRWGKRQEALEELNKALEAFKGQKNYLFQSRILNSIALARQAEQNMKPALDAARLALEAAVLSGDELEIAEERLLYARLKMESDIEDSEIEGLLFQALDCFKQKNKKMENANTAAMIGLYYLRRRELEKAESFFKDSLHIEEMLHRSLGMASDYGNLGLIAQKKGDKARAAEYWKKAAVLFENSGDRKMADYFFKRSGSLIPEAEEVLLPGE